VDAPAVAALPFSSPSRGTKLLWNSNCGTRCGSGYSHLLFSSKGWICRSNASGDHGCDNSRTFFEEMPSYQGGPGRPASKMYARCSLLNRYPKPALQASNRPGADFSRFPLIEGPQGSLDVTSPWAQTPPSKLGHRSSLFDTARRQSQAGVTPCR